MIANFVNLADNKFTLNGIEYHKNYAPIQVNQSDSQVRVISAYDSRFALVPPTHYSEFTVNGITYNSVESLIHALVDVVFSKFTLDGVAKEFQDSVLQYVDDLQSDISGFKVDVNNDLQQITAEKQVFQSEAQEIKDAVANMTTTGKIYDSLADAIAESPKPADGTPFSVIGDGDNDGYWKFDSTQPDGVKFGRKFDRRIQVESISQIKNYKGSPGEAVDVLGYYESGDGGGGAFYWDSGSTETDNGGTVIEANGVVNGRWKRVLNGVINAKWFGVKGDGITDDSEKLVASFAALKSGERYVLPDGVYGIVEIGISQKKRCVFDFLGVFKAIDGADYNRPVGIIGCDGSVFNGLTIDGNRENTNDRMVAGNQPNLAIGSLQNNLTFNNLTLKNSMYPGVVMNGGNEDLVFNGITFENIGEHGIYIAGGESKRLRVRDVVAVDIGMNPNRNGECHIFKIRYTAFTGGNEDFVFENIDLTYKNPLPVENIATAFYLIDIKGLIIRNLKTLSIPAFTLSPDPIVENVFLEKITASELIRIVTGQGVLRNINIKDSVFNDKYVQWINVFENIENCVFDGNRIIFRNVAVHKEHEYKTKFKDCKFLNQSASGGVMASFLLKDLTFENCIFETDVPNNQSFPFVLGNSLAVEGVTVIFRGCRINGSGWSAGVGAYGGINVKIIDSNLDSRIRAATEINSLQIIDSEVPEIFISGDVNNINEITIRNSRNLSGSALLPKSGTQANRPNVKFIDIGYSYFDTTLEKLIWYNGTDWVDATGTIV